MKRSYLLALCAMSFIILSCINEDSVEEVLGQIENVKFTDAELAILFQMRGESTKVDMNEAVQYANDVIGFLDGEVATRSGSARSISSMVALTSDESRKAVTRTSGGEILELPDTVAYLFNFGEEEGFAIVSGDKRINSPILGYCGSGSLEGGIDNPGLAGILLDIEDYITHSIANYESQKDSITYEILAKMSLEDSTTTRKAAPTNELLQQYMLEIIEDPERIKTTSTTTTTIDDWVTTSIMHPLLPVEWGQSFPFNNLVKNKNGCTNAPAGCVATATAQLMAYWQYPTSIDGHAFNWSLLRSHTGRPNAYPNVKGKKRSLSVDATSGFAMQVSRLMERIGDHVKMKYREGGSGTTSKEAILFLSKCGYTTDHSHTALLFTGGFEDYNYNNVIGSLNNYRPVYAKGYTKKIKHKALGITVSTSYEGGHAWIIDGYLNQRQAKTVQVTVRRKSSGMLVSQTTTVTYSYANYLHHNWGWNGDHNGYFVEGSYNSNDKRFESNGPTTRSAENYNFQYKKNICTNIKL